MIGLEDDQFLEAMSILKGGSASRWKLKGMWARRGTVTLGGAMAALDWRRAWQLFEEVKVGLPCFVDPS